MAEDDKPKRQNKVGSYIAIAVIFLIIGILIGGAGNNSKPTAVNSPSSSTQTTTATSTSSAPKAATPPPAPKVLLSLSGNGDQQTKQFTTTGNWTMAYTYNCSNNGGNGVFAVNISNADGSTNNDNGPDEDGASGGTTDYYYDAGQHYLSIDADCVWHIVVKG